MERRFASQGDNPTKTDREGNDGGRNCANVGRHDSRKNGR